MDCIETPSLTFRLHKALVGQVRSDSRRNVPELRKGDSRIETIMTLSWINLWIAIAMSLAGQTLLKAGAMTRRASTELLAQFLDPRTVAGLTLYVAAAFLYIIALRHRLAPHSALRRATLHGRLLHWRNIYRPFFIQ